MSFVWSNCVCRRGQPPKLASGDMYLRVCFDDGLAPCCVRLFSVCPEEVIVRVWRARGLGNLLLGRGCWASGRALRLLHGSDRDRGRHDGQCLWVCSREERWTADGSRCVQEVEEHRMSLNVETARPRPSPALDPCSLNLAHLLRSAPPSRACCRRDFSQGRRRNRSRDSPRGK